MMRAAVLILVLSGATGNPYGDALQSLRYPEDALVAGKVSRAIRFGWPREGDRDLATVSRENARAAYIFQRVAQGGPKRLPAGPDAAPGPAPGQVFRMTAVMLLEARRLEAAGDPLTAGRLCVDVLAFAQDVTRGAPLQAWIAKAHIETLAADVLADLTPAIAQAEAERKPPRGKRVVDAVAALDRREPSLPDAVRLEKKRQSDRLRLALKAVGEGGAEPLDILGIRPGSAADGKALLQALKEGRRRDVETWPSLKRLDLLAESLGKPVLDFRGPALMAPLKPPSNAVGRRLWFDARTAAIAAAGGRTRRLLATVALAAAEGRRKGRRSAALGPTIKGLLEPTPMDPFTGFPFRYIPMPRGFAVYSDGPDRGDDHARRETPLGGERGDLVLWVPRGQRFVWRSLEPVARELRKGKRLRLMKWDARRPEQVFLIGDRRIYVGDARKGSMRRFARSSLERRPYRVRAMAFGPHRAWLATTRGLFAYWPKRRLWRRVPVADLAAPECLDARVTGGSLDVLLGPAAAPSAFHLDLTSADTTRWTRGAGETASIWARKLARPGPGRVSRPAGPGRR